VWKMRSSKARSYWKGGGKNEIAGVQERKKMWRVPSSTAPGWGKVSGRGTIHGDVSGRRTMKKNNKRILSQRTNPP